MPHININTILLNGSLDGPRKVDMGVSRNCIMFVIPRDNINEVTDDTLLHQHCFYILLGTDTTGGPKAYIGQSYDFTARVRDHLVKKDFWKAALVFVSKTDEIFQSEVAFLEYLGITTAMKVGTYNLDENKQVPKKPRISSSQESAMELFFNDIKLLTRFFNDCRLFEDAAPKAKPQPKKYEPAETFHEFNFILTKKGVNARIRYYEKSQRYILLAGSTVMAEEGPSLRPAFKKMRAELFATTKAVKKGEVYEISSDYDMPVTSPSSAAMLIAGTSRNGSIDLVDDSGKSFKDVYCSTSHSSNSNLN